MANKVGIGIEAQLDTSSVEQRINAFGQRVAQANRVQFSPISVRGLDDLETARKKFEQLLRVHGELNRRVKATGQAGKSPWDMDFGSMFPSEPHRAKQMRRVMEYSFGANFTDAPATPAAPGRVPTPPGGRVPPPVSPPAPPAPPAPSGWGQTGVGVAQAGLRAAGPAGGVAANSLGTGVSAGFGAGLMGLMGGMLALGVGKLVGSVTEKIGAAEQNNIALDRLKRTLGDVGVSFGGLKDIVRLNAERFKITYDEAGQLATQFTKLGNVSADRYKELGDEVGVGVGMSRAFGLDPAQGNGVMGQMRGLGVTSNVQESRRFALLIGETIGKAGAFAKADEVMESIAGFAATQARATLSSPNTSGFAGMFAGMVGSGIAGLDPAGANSILSRVNASLAAGGAKGEASQFLTARVGNRLGLDPLQTQVFREGGMFATKRAMFGEGSAYDRYMGGAMAMGKDADTTHFHARLEELKRDPAYAGNKLLTAQAMANDTGLSMNHAMTLMDIAPKKMGEMEKYADIGNLSVSGIGNLTKSLHGTPEDRSALASEFLGRAGDKAISASDRIAINGASGDDSKLRDVLAQISAKYDQEKTLGGDIRDSKAMLDNIKTNLADKLVPYVNEMRMGIMSIAGANEKKSPKDIIEAVMRSENKDKEREISGKREADMKGNNLALGETRTQIRDTMLKNQDKVLKGEMTREQHLREMIPLQKREQELIKRDAEIREEHSKAMADSKKALEANIEKMRKGEEAEAAATAGLAKGDKQGPLGVAPGAAGGAGGGAGRGSVNPASAGGAGGGSSVKAGTDEFDELFVKYGKQYGVDPKILKAIAIKESGMRPGVISPPNANGTRDYGLMQHNGRYLADRGLTEDWKNPERAIEEAAKLLASNTKRGGSVQAGVRMYNGRGPKAEAYSHDVLDMAGRVSIREGGEASEPRRRSTPLPAQAATPPTGAAGGFRVSADDITVRVVDANGMPRQAAQTISTRVSQAVPFGAAMK